MRFGEQEHAERCFVNCPNIHWYCHTCNDSNRSVSSSIDRMNEAIGLLANSLSGDLSTFINNFSVVMDKFIGSIGSINLMQNSMNDVPATATSHEQKLDSNENTNFIDRSAQRSIQSNVEQCHHDEVRVIGDSVQRKSVVVSNIGKDVSADHLCRYLVDKLKISKDFVSLSLLLPSGKTIDDVTFLQYKLTVPASMYKSVMCSDSWPKNVRLRDFVYKPKNLNVVPRQHFLSKSELSATFVS